MTSRLRSGARDPDPSRIRGPHRPAGYTWVDKRKQCRSNWGIGPGVGRSRTRISILLFCLSGDGILGDTDWRPSCRNCGLGNRKTNHESSIESETSVLAARTRFLSGLRAGYAFLPVVFCMALCMDMGQANTSSKGRQQGGLGLTERLKVSEAPGRSLSSWKSGSGPNIEL